jgi:hypothetical protein
MVTVHREDANLLVRDAGKKQKDAAPPDTC